MVTLGSPKPLSRLGSGLGSGVEVGVGVGVGVGVDLACKWARLVWRSRQVLSHRENQMREIFELFLNHF